MLEEKTSILERAPQITLEIYKHEEDEDLESTSDACEKASFGDLYLLGKLWIEILQTGLLGTKWKLPPLIPVVEAAQPPPPPPKKPPKMKYKDLPLYECPHYEYKAHLKEKQRCPGLNRKLIHEKILPHVTSYRNYISTNYTDFVTEARSMKKQAIASINNTLSEYIAYMRCKKNLRLRQGVVALSGALGFLWGRRYKDRLTPRILFSAVGMLAAGALCFPDETDENFRCVSYRTGKFIIAFYNRYCGKSGAMRERIPCQSDFPEPSPPRTQNKCPRK